MEKWGVAPVPLSNCNKIGNQMNTEQEKWGSVALLVECVCGGEQEFIDKKKQQRINQGQCNGDSNVEPLMCGETVGHCTT